MEKLYSFRKIQYGTCYNCIHCGNIGKADSDRMPIAWCLRMQIIVAPEIKYSCFESK